MIGMIGGLLGRVDREVGPGTEGREMAVADVAEVVCASAGMFQGCRCRLVSCFVAYDANVGLSESGMCVLSLHPR